MTPTICQIRTNRNRPWRAKVMKAIRHAGDSRLEFYVKQMPLHAGLYAIREFERINGCQLDPDNATHMMTIAGMGRWARMFAMIDAKRARKVIERKMGEG